MPNVKVSELEPLYNLQDEDLIEITKYMGEGLGDGGGDFKSYSMTFETFKLFLPQFKVTELTFTAAGSQVYQLDQFEVVKDIVYKNTVIGGAITVIDTQTTAVILDETTENFNTINHYKRSVNYLQRRLTITVTDACTVKIISITGL